MKITNRLMKMSKPRAIQEVNSTGFNSLDRMLNNMNMSYKARSRFSILHLKLY